MNNDHQLNRLRIAVAISRYGLDVDPEDITAPASGDDLASYTIDGMPWQQWLKAMTQD